jgi:endonuclease G
LIGITGLLGALVGCASAGSRSTTQTAHAVDTISESNEIVSVGTRRGYTRVVLRQSGVTTEHQRLVDSLCVLGQPHLDPAFGYGRTRIVARVGYALEHSDADRIPLWVCERVRSAQLEGELTRANPFRADPLLPPQARAELTDYRGSGFDRGHMAPAGNQTADRTLKDETFFLSNIAPQHPRLNQRTWAALEDQVRDWAEQRREVWVITGPMFYDPAEEDESTADGQIDYSILNGRVAVPTHFFKVVAARTGSGGWDLLTFVAENRAYSDRTRISDFIVPLSWLEQRVGIDFLPALEAHMSEIETRTPQMWP